MRPVFARGNQQTAKILLELRKQALKDDEPRVAQRFHAVALSIEGYTSQRIAQVLKVHRSSVPLWIENWNQRRETGLLEGHRSGRPGALSKAQQEQLQDILDSGPVAYGLETGIWTSPVISRIIAQEFDVEYHPGHVRKLLKQWATRCNGQPLVWCRPIRCAKTAGCVTPIHALKKSPE